MCSIIVRLGGDELIEERGVWWVGRHLGLMVMRLSWQDDAAIRIVIV